MRCLYCGKELALFKRLRGGEFCSDAHRQNYQAEYTQLALNRLLQANGAKEPEADKTRSAVAVDTKPDPKPLESPALKRRERLNREESPAASAPAQVLPLPHGRGSEAVTESPVTFRDSPVGPVAAPVAAIAEPATAAAEGKTLPTEDDAPEPEPEEPGPAGPVGFFIEVPILEIAETPTVAQAETGLLLSGEPVLPRMRDVGLNTASGSNPDGMVLSGAGRVPQPRSAPVDSYAAPRERGLEVREFVRSQPILEIRLALAGATGLTTQQTHSDSHEKQHMDVEFGSYAPQDPPPFWQGPPREFPTPAVDFVGIARLDFETEGWDAAPPIGVAAPSESARPRPVLAEPVSLDRIRFAGLTDSFAEPAPVKVEERFQSRPTIQSSPAPALIPEAVTKPVPLTLHGLAPTRAKPAQGFASAAARPAEIQIPRQNTLPLRPVMVLGPAPIAEPETKTPAAKVPDARIQTDKPIRPATVPDQIAARPSSAKQRKSEVRVLSPQPRQDAKKEARPEAKPDFKLGVNPAPSQPSSQPKMQSPSESGPEAPQPDPAKSAVKQPKPALPESVKTSVQQDKSETKPQAADAIEPDLLGLPKLSLEAEGSFWSKLPAAARIGVAAGVLAAIAGGVFLTSKGSSAPRAASVTSQPVPSIAPAGPPIGSDAGWATDWFTDSPGSRQARHVDVLKGSLALQDYRMEFEGQIEQQALGWVFRANNKSNFYVEKVAIVTPGLEPTVALIRFAVVDGKEQPRVQVALPIKAHLDTLYKIRTDVVGHQFTTWVQDRQVDQWTDSHIDAGGAGLYYDGGDSAKLKGTINLTPLKAR